MKSLNVKTSRAEAKISKISHTRAFSTLSSKIMTAWRSASLNILEEKFHGNHLSGSLQSEEAARVHALKVVEVLKNEIKVNDDIF